MIDADPVVNARCFGALRFSTGCRRLNRQRAFDGRNHAAEFDECAVNHELDNAPTMSGDAGIEDLASVILQPFERAGFVGLHQTAVAGDVG